MQTCHTLLEAIAGWPDVGKAGPTWTWQRFSLVTDEDPQGQNVSPSFPFELVCYLNNKPIFDDQFGETGSLYQVHPYWISGNN